MLATLGVGSVETLVDQTVPTDIRLEASLRLPAAQGEHETLAELRALAAKNRIFRSHLGMGYYDTHTPPVIQRNILENPGWYTAYTPYQAEISQGRLEALLNFQTMVTDLTGLDIANASLLDEATAAAEAMTMSHGLRKNAAANTFFVSRHCHPQTLHVVQTRALPLDIEVVVGDEAAGPLPEGVFGVLLQYPASTGEVFNYAHLIEAAHAQGALVTLAADLLALTLLKSPGELGADIAVGSSQRFGVPLGYGGPHAAYFATKDAYKRSMPGRLIGVSRDAHGNPACRLSLQTREQHIRRDKATSNICTAQVLLAVMAGMYAVYHGPQGLARIARRVHLYANTLASGLRQLGWNVSEVPFFDTVRVDLGDTPASEIVRRAEARQTNLRVVDAHTISISLDETTDSLDDLFSIFAPEGAALPDTEALAATVPGGFDDALQRTSDYLAHPVFNTHHTETEMLRYIRRLESKDLSLTHSMISLGSCTMKLNATTQMLPVTWPEFGRIHPFAPVEQAQGYAELFAQLESWLAEITGFAGVSLQPNAGSSGEYAGLLAIRGYHLEHGNVERTVCLIPQSAHGTNPASAVMAGFKVVPVKCTEVGNIDIEDLRAKAAQHAAELGAIMLTYPSTHGVFEATVREVCEIIHQHGGQVYMDGANMNAQVGLTSPGHIGADVCHLNLHKTFCIPHGGGGPGVGPIGVAGHLVPHLPSHPLLPPGEGRIGPVAAAPWGSASILCIPWAYIRMMGGEGLTEATRHAILAANYMARRLEPFYPVVYKGEAGFVAHECIIDLRPFKALAGVEVEDVAKRLMDYGFHAPTMSWPVVGTLMVEPTESESKAEMDRFCDALIAIHGEITAIAEGKLDRVDNPLKNAPHTAASVVADEWAHAYPREQAAYPAPWLREFKFWPTVGRVDNVYGDRNLVCSCVGMEAYDA